uniref:UDP-glucuronosyltransferase n=1 Tax=Panagrellus redivivus TaxID=6233 RepID=A0A7E4WD07_PANRE
MTSRLSFLLLCLLVPVFVDAYKILVFNPKFGQSHTNFMGRLADTLVDAGHDVAVYQPILNENITSTGSKSPKVRFFVLPKNASLYEGFSMEGYQEVLWSNEIGSLMKSTQRHRIRLCQEILDDEKNIAALKAEKFDLFIVEHFEVCGYAFLRRLGITKYVSSTSAGLYGAFTAELGVKPHLSYNVGFLSSHSDKMNFVERVQRFIGHFFETLMIRQMFTSHNQVIHKYFPDFESGTALAKAAFFFVNADEHLDYVQPITPKVVYIANLGNGEPKPLPEKYEKVVESAKRGVVLFSFGSVVLARSMPKHVKKAFLEAFKEFPDVTFLWKYETPEDGTAETVPSNVITSKWLPQRDLLHNPKLLAFISHAGQNSFNEAIGAGVPMLCLPVFADQPRNAHHIVSKGLGLQLNHKGLTKAKVVKALKEILDNDTYRKKAQLVSNIMKTKGSWQTPETRFIKNVEFAAQFGDTGTLSAAGAEQNAFVFHSLDVIGFLSLVLIAVLLLVKALVKTVVRGIRKLLGKQKTE